MRFEYETTPVGFDQRVRLRPLIVFSSIVTAWPTGLCGLNALAVNDRRCTTGIAADAFTIEHDQRMIDLLELTFVVKFRKSAIDCTPRRKITRQQTPRAARPHHIEGAIDDFTHRPLARPALRAGLW